MNILEVCTRNDLNTLSMIINIINIIKIAIPFILITYVIIKLLRSKELNKDLIKLFIINALIAIVILFLPNIVFMLNKYIGYDKISCMQIIDKNTMKTLKVLNQKDNLSKEDYEYANYYYKKISSDEIKNLLQNDMDKLRYNTGFENISTKLPELINSYKNSFDDKVYNEIISLYDKITNEEDKVNYENEIINIKSYMQIKKDIDNLKENYDKTKYNEIQTSISEIKDDSIKNKLETLLNESRNTNKIDIATGVHDIVKTSNFGYITAVPLDPVEDMPLVVGINGLSADGIYENIMPNIKTKFMYIAAYTAAQTSWQDDGALNNVISLINEYINKYKVDKNKIVIIGYSIGAIGVWEIVSKNPDFFSDAVPVSCWGPYFRAESFKNTRVLAFSGDTGEDELGYASKMKGYVDKINSIGGNATYTQFTGKNHRGSGHILSDVELYKKIFNE